MPYSKRRGSRDFNYAGLDGGKDGGDVPVGAEDVDPEDVCPQCSRPVSNWDPAIRCDSCETWNHAKCEGMSEIEYGVLIQSKGMGHGTPPRLTVIGLDHFIFHESLHALAC